jgi:hypothetical protein
MIWQRVESLGERKKNGWIMLMHWVSSSQKPEFSDESFRPVNIVDYY